MAKRLKTLRDMGGSDAIARLSSASTSSRSRSRRRSRRHRPRVARVATRPFAAVQRSITVLITILRAQASNGAPDGRAFRPVRIFQESGIERAAASWVFRSVAGTDAHQHGIKRLVQRVFRAFIALDASLYERFGHQDDRDPARHGAGRVPGPSSGSVHLHEADGRGCLSAAQAQGVHARAQGAAGQAEQAGSASELAGPCSRTRPCMSSTTISGTSGLLQLKGHVQLVLTGFGQTVVLRSTGSSSMPLAPGSARSA